MDDLTFNRQILIDNLRTDVLTLDKVLRHLLFSFASTLPPAALRSWKYPGNSVLDVDIDTLIKCFGHPKASQTDAERARSHVILLELAIDRLSAIMAVAIYCLQHCCSLLSLKKEKKTVVRTGSLPALATTYVATFLDVLEVWGVGSAKKATGVAENQTDCSYDPHEDCAICKELLRIIDVVQKFLTENFGKEFDGPLVEPILPDLFKKLDHYIKDLIEKHQTSLEEVANQQEKLKECTSALNVQAIKNDELERQLEHLKKSIIKGKSEVQEIEIEIFDSRKILESLQKQETDEMNLAADLQNKVQCVTLECGDLQKKAKDLEAEVAAHESNRSSENARWTTLIKEKENELQDTMQKVDDLEKCFDSQWQDKLHQAQQNLAEITSLVKNAQAIYERNKERIRQLEVELCTGCTESVA